MTRIIAVASHDIKSHQVIQTIMLTFLMGGMGWIAISTVENVHALVRFEEVFRHQDEQISRMILRMDKQDSELQRIKTAENVFEHRITTLESRMTP